MTYVGNKDEITFSELIELVWQRKWLVIGITALFAAGSVAYAVFAQQRWRAETLLIPSEQKGTGLAANLGALGGLAGIAGINLSDDTSSEALATLQSAEFIGAFIQDQNLLPLLFPHQWDADQGQWRGSDQKQWPDSRDGVRLFQRRILGVSEDPGTRLVTVSVEWTDPVVAAQWANALVERLNARTRERALREAERNVAFLRQELAGANVVTLQESVARLLEREMQNMMLARGNPEYSFRVIDRAAPPKWRARPKRILVVILSTVGGGLVAVFVAVLIGRRATARPVATTRI